MVLTMHCPTSYYASQATFGAQSGSRSRRRELVPNAFQIYAAVIHRFVDRSESYPQAPGIGASAQLKAALWAVKKEAHAGMHFRL
jgi:hypothetical protein